MSSRIADMVIRWIPCCVALACGPVDEPAGSVSGALCTPACEGKECGDDGCGGECGTCKEGWDCVVDRCVFGCGDITINGCCRTATLVHCLEERLAEYDCSATGKSCRWVSISYGCVAEESWPLEDPSGKYPRECDFTCTPKCDMKWCGPDGCGGECGQCGGGKVCYNGMCCQPQCEGMECGPDLCGGQCGQCPAGGFCDDTGKCHYGYGCMETPGTPGCAGCACEKCVCETDEYCCTDEWDGKCAWACKAICGGCLPCTDCGEPGPEEGLPDAPEASDDAEVPDVPPAEVVVDPSGDEGAAGDSPAAPDESATADTPVADDPAGGDTAPPDNASPAEAPPEVAGDTSPEPIDDPGGAPGEATRLDAGARGGGSCSAFDGAPAGRTAWLLVLAMGAIGCVRLRGRR